MESERTKNIRGGNSLILLHLIPLLSRRPQTFSEQQLVLEELAAPHHCGPRAAASHAGAPSNAARGGRGPGEGAREFVAKNISCRRWVTVSAHECTCELGAHTLIRHYKCVSRVPRAHTLIRQERLGRRWWRYRRVATP